MWSLCDTISHPSLNIWQKSKHSAHQDTNEAAKILATGLSNGTTNSNKTSNTVPGMSTSNTAVITTHRPHNHWIDLHHILELPLPLEPLISCSWCLVITKTVMKQPALVPIRLPVKHGVWRAHLSDWYEKGFIIVVYEKIFLVLP